MTAAPRFALRVDPDLLESWRTAASRNGQSISAWLHDAASAHLGQPRGPLPTPGTTDPGESHERRPRRKRPSSVDCPHPRGALIVVNAGLGLKRCGACGDTVRS